MRSARPVPGPPAVTLTPAPPWTLPSPSARRESRSRTTWSTVRRWVTAVASVPARRCLRHAAASAPPHHSRLFATTWPPHRLTPTHCRARTASATAVALEASERPVDVPSPAKLDFTRRPGFQGRLFEHRGNVIRHGLLNTRETVNEINPFLQCPFLFAGLRFVFSVITNCVWHQTKCVNFSEIWYNWLSMFGFRIL